MKIEEGDTWLVIGPGRTGSKVIIDFIRAVYWRAGINIRYFDPNQNINDACGAFIKHSHYFEDLSYQYKYIVYSKRDPVESALSWLIQKKIVHWHLYVGRHDYIIDKGIDFVKPFYMPVDEFLTRYNLVNWFYKEVNLPKHAKIIEYNNFKDDPYLLFDILDIEEKFTLERLPVKNPGEHKQWILNWEEIELEISKLRNANKSITE